MEPIKQSSEHSPPPVSLPIYLTRFVGREIAFIQNPFKVQILLQMLDTIKGQQ